MMMTTIRAATLLAASFGIVTAANALVLNGSFETSTYTANSQFGGGFGGQGVTDWVGGAGNDLQIYYFGGTQTSVSAANQYGDPLTYFYPTFTTLSPDGGNFVALDGDSVVRGNIAQTITGLTPGQSYNLKFYWAATQLINRSGATTEQLQIDFGGVSQFTAVVPNASGGFTGWFTETFTVTATSATEILKFILIGTPNGLPPIAVLDGVSLTATPEPAALALFGLGFAGIAAARLRRR